MCPFSKIEKSEKHSTLLYVQDTANILIVNSVKSTFNIPREVKRKKGKVQTVMYTHSCT